MAKAAVKKTPASKAKRPPKVAKPKPPDDLKRISGVGPKLEEVLKGLGVYRYAQIAKWTKPEVEWVD
ncbi:MAG: NADH dehydrogenase subunit E, partial [Salaquimonas sp.]